MGRSGRSVSDEIGREIWKQVLLKLNNQDVLRHAGVSPGLFTRDSPTLMTGE
jgi:hypothetical protein